MNPVKAIMLLALICLPGLASGTSVVPKPLEEMVREADHIVVAKIVSVDMVDGRGKPITDREARTGPGSPNRMRFNLEVHEVLFAGRGSPSRRLRVPLWSMWHYSLGTMQDDLTGVTGIFLLKGDANEPVYPAGFQRPLKEKNEVQRLIGARP